MIKVPFFQATNARPITFITDLFSLQAEGLVAWWVASLNHTGNTTTNPTIYDDFFRWGTSGTTSTDFATGTNQEVADLIGGTDLGGLCVNFDGSNEFTNYGVGQRQQGEMSVCAWVRPTSVAAGQRTIVAEASSSTLVDYALCVNINAGKYRFQQADSANGTDATTSLTVNVWQHLAAVRTGSAGSWTITYYYNGIADGSYAETANPDSGAGHLLAVGRYGLLNALFFAGDIADVRVYNRALSASEIAHQYEPATRWDLYRPQNQGTPALWKLGQGAHIFYPAIHHPQIHQKLMVV